MAIMKTMYFTRLAIVLLFSIVNFSLTAQVKVGNNPTTISSSAIFEVESTSKGVLLPRISLTSKNDVTTIPSPSTGLLIYNSATAGTAPNDVVPGYYYWDGNVWAKMTSSANSSNNVSTWAVGEERAFSYKATAASLDVLGLSKVIMSGKAVTNVTTTNYKLLSEAMAAEGGNIGGALSINGLRLDFMKMPNANSYSPRFVNTTSNAITYSIVSWSTANQYLDGTKTVIAGNAICFAVDGDNLLLTTNNATGEAVHGMIVFTTGEWYAFMFYPIIIDNELQGYTTARRIR